MKYNVVLTLEIHDVEAVDEDAAVYEAETYVSQRLSYAVHIKDMDAYEAKE